MNTNLTTLIKVTAASFAVIILCLSGCAETRETPDSESGGEIEWIRSESEGLALAKQENKPVFIDFYADWCTPCKQMEKVTFRDKRVIEELARFVAIKADMTRPDSPGQAAGKKYNVAAWPTFALINSQGQTKIIMGYRSPEEFLRQLQAVK